MKVFTKVLSLMLGLILTSSLVLGQANLGQQKIKLMQKSAKVAAEKSGLVQKNDGKPGGVSPYASKDETIRYDDGVNNDAIGLTSGGTFQVSAYFPAAIMGTYSGMVLEQMEIYINNVPNPCVLKIYGPGTSTTPGALLHEQTITPVEASWNLIDLTTPVDITGDDLWLGYQVTHGAGFYPAGCDAGPHVLNGDWIEMNGAWDQLHILAPALDYNWNIVGYLVDGGPQLTNDVGVQSIVSPVTGPDLGDEVVTIAVKNYGTATQSNIPVSFTLDGGAAVNATVAGPIASGAVVNYTFPGTVNLGNVGQTYVFYACTAMAGDENNANNCKTANVTNVIPTYCDATTTTEDEYISNVLCGDINNSSGWQGGVADYTDQVVTIAAGNSEAITVTNPTPYSADQTTVWVDWNMNYTFDSGDETFVLTNVGGTGASFTGSITAPASAPTGDYRMRVRMTYSTAPTPCGSSTYGEVEDYTVHVGNYLAPPTNLTAVANDNDVTLNWTAPTTKDLLGYNVYRNASMLTYVTVTTYVDMDLNPGTYNYQVKAVYDEGTSGPSNTATVTIANPPGYEWCDDFESYTVGQKLAQQADPTDWTTWSNAPGGAEDPFVQSNGSKIIEVLPNNDLVHPIAEYTTGYYTISFDMYIPTGFVGYFNTLQDFAGANSQWGMQVYFGSDNAQLTPGVAWIDGGAALAASFDFEYDTWMTIELPIDLTNDWAEMKVNGTLVHGWVWSGGSFGTGTLNQLGGSNFYGWTPTAGGGQGKYHFDNYCIVEGEGPELAPPTNLTADVTNNDVHLDWDAPSGGGTGELIELIQHDGNFENGYFQAFGSGYGVVYDLSGYSDVTVEFLDYHHDSWGTTGIWNYKLHIVDWDTYSEISVIGPLQTTGNDQWELNIPLGSVPESGLVGIFLEPMGNVAADAYPCLSSDNVGPDGMSYFGPLSSYSGMALSGIGDFLMDLWIMGSTSDGLVKAVKYAPNYGNGAAHVAGPAPLTGELTLKQNKNGAKAVLMGYNVYRNNTNIGYVATPTTEYDDMDLAAGSYDYKVTAVYDEGESIYSNVANAIIENPVPPAPTNLVATDGGTGILLTWDEVGSGEWIRWDAAVNNGNGIGLTNGGSFSCASHWAPADLTNYNGFSLTKVQFWPNADPAATYVIKVWTGAAGTTLVHQQNVTSFVVDSWNEVILTTPVVISSATDFWFGYTCTHGAGTFPAGCDDGPAVPYKGDMISTGGAWVSMSTDYGLDYNWNIAGYVGLADGKSAPIVPMNETVAPFNFNASLQSAAQYGLNDGPAVKFVPNTTKDFTYNVYRKGQGGTYGTALATGITGNTYLDVAPPYGWNYYIVRTVQNGTESLNSNEVSFLWTSIEDVIYNQTQVYPNPANGIVNIKSDFEIKSVKVYNHAGQAVANESTDTKFYQFDASQLNAGLYMFQIETAEGTITKRIIVE